jgi:hypothetical protein
MSSLLELRTLLRTDTLLTAQRSVRGRLADLCALNSANRLGKRSTTTFVSRTAREEISFLPRSVNPVGPSQSDNMLVSSATGLRWAGQVPVWHAFAAADQGHPYLSSYG